MLRRRFHAIVLLAFFLLSSGPACAQVWDLLSFRALGQAYFPVLGDEAYYSSITGGGSLFAEIKVFPFLTPFLQATGVYVPVTGVDPLGIFGYGVGVGLSLTPIERLELRLDGMGGIYTALYKISGTDVRVENYYWGGLAEVGFRVSPSITISANGGFTQYLGKSEPLLSAATAGLTFTLHLDGFSPSRVKITDPKVESVFPVFYSYYDDHSFGSVSVSNGEETEIRDVKVSFFGPYMSQPKVCATIPSIPRGGSVKVPLYAIFNDQVLSLTENTKTPGEVIVDFSLLGSGRQVRAAVPLQFFHRNAMSWDDDRRASAFVSSTDPAALWFARFVTSIVRDRLRVNLNANLQFAIGLFEAERLYGLNYVVDPTSSYAVNSAEESVIDYLQYPHQTLFYRGGDCDDLSILFSALLESVGIRTAFITIPGHIYMAFALGMSEAEARSTFFDPSILIYRDGQAWVPVEITLVKEGFVKAWRIGAKEWVDNAKIGKANFYPNGESWKLYAPVGIPDVNPRFTLPDEVLTIQAFDDSVDRFVAREIDSSVREFRAGLESGDSPPKANSFGILYGRYGMLKESWTQFSRAAKADYSYAWTNLGNISFLRKDYKLALSYYQWALTRDPDDTSAMLGIARSQYELEYFTEAEKAYDELKKRDPALAVKYGYLTSTFGGEGRAWSFAERLSNTVWGEPSRHVAVIKPPASQPTKTAALPPATQATKTTAIPSTPQAAMTVTQPPQKAPEIPSTQTRAPAAVVAPSTAYTISAAEVAAQHTAPQGMKSAVQAAAPPYRIPGSTALPTDNALAVAALTPEKTPAQVAASATSPVHPSSKASADVPPYLAQTTHPSVHSEIQTLPAATPQPAPAAKAMRAGGRTQIVELPSEDVDLSLKKTAIAPAPAPAQKPTQAPPAAPIVQSPASSPAPALKPVQVPPAMPTVQPPAAPPVAPPTAPPRIADLPPEDADLALKRAAQAPAVPAPAQKTVQAPQAPPATPAVQSPVAPPASPPRIADLPPEDADLALKRAAQAPAVPTPAQKTVQAPAVAPAVSPVGSAPAQKAVQAPQAPQGQPPATPAVQIPAAPAAQSPAASPATPTAPAVQSQVAPPAAASAAQPPAATTIQFPAASPTFPPSAAVAKPIYRAPTTPSSSPTAVMPSQVIVASIPPVVAPPAARAITGALLLEGFETAKPVLGDWTVTPTTASQNDPRICYAKLETPLTQSNQHLRYSFTAHSDGIDWVGFGLHIFVTPGQARNGYGVGESILVWLTHDPNHNGDWNTHLQVYRSNSDVSMDLETDVVVPESVFDSHEISIDMDTAQDLLTVAIDGNERLSCAGFSDFKDGVMVVFRALDLATFSDFRVEELP